MISEELQHAKILIVDDQKSNIDLIKAILEIDNYTDVKSTTDSRLVVELVKTYNPDLILLDLIMPNLSGYEVMEQLKSVYPDKYLPILVLTADVTGETKQKALAHGAKDFLCKPFDLIEVRYRIKNLLETQYLFKKIESRKELFEKNIIEFLKYNDEWYR
jgi:CheY-like chemotaxis protein